MGDAKSRLKKNRVELKKNWIEYRDIWNKKDPKRIFWRYPAYKKWYEDEHKLGTDTVYKAYYKAWEYRNLRKFIFHYLKLILFDSI